MHSTNKPTDIRRTRLPKFLAKENDHNKYTELQINLEKKSFSDKACELLNYYQNLNEIVLELDNQEGNWRKLDSFSACQDRNNPERLLSISIDRPPVLIATHPDQTFFLRYHKDYFGFGIPAIDYKNLPCCAIGDDQLKTDCKNYYPVEWLPLRSPESYYPVEFHALENVYVTSTEDIKKRIHEELYNSEVSLPEKEKEESIPDFPTFLRQFQITTNKQ